jgi:hypothetical protein
MVGAENGLGLSAAMDPDAAAHELALQQIARRRIELTVHQMPGQMQHHYIHAASAQGGGSFEAQQAAADNHGAAIGLCRHIDHGVHIV